ncbi:MAG TPA: DNA processing protein DprA, partial [Mycobacterium sp.]|nr:DNA processing protein DprA [Mycobacterium sp.]
MSDQARRAWAYLSRVVEQPCRELAELAARVGPVEAAERIRRGVVDDQLVHHTAARRDNDCAADDLEILARRGGRLITADDDEWPGLALAAFGGVIKPDCLAPMA